MESRNKCVIIDFNFIFWFSLKTMSVDKYFLLLRD